MYLPNHSAMGDTRPIFKRAKADLNSVFLLVDWLLNPICFADTWGEQMKS